MADELTNSMRKKLKPVLEEIVYGSANSHDVVAILLPFFTIPIHDNELHVPAPAVLSAVQDGVLAASLQLVKKIPFGEEVGA
jgi:hypothetical protein